MKYQYKTIDTSTLRGLKQAESLKANGWRLISVGLYTLIFEKLK